MSNVKAPPAWLTDGLAAHVQRAMDRQAATNALRRVGLSGAEIVAIERIAAVRAMPAEQVAGDLVRAALAAINAAGRGVIA